jgi:hypothetical protein
MNPSISTRLTEGLKSLGNAGFRAQSVLLSVVGQLHKKRVGTFGRAEASRRFGRRFWCCFQGGKAEHQEKDSQNSAQQIRSNRAPPRPRFRRDMDWLHDGITDSDEYRLESRGGRNHSDFSGSRSPIRRGHSRPFFIKPELSLRLSVRDQIGKGDHSRLGLATITSYQKTSRGCIAYINVEGVTDGYERLFWELSLGKPDADVTSSTVDIQEGTSETVILVYSKDRDSPYYFDSMEHQTDDEEKYKLEPEKDYKVKVLIVDKNRREKEWSVVVNSSIDKHGLGLFGKDETAE